MKHYLPRQAKTEKQHNAILDEDTNRSIKLKPTSSLVINNFLTEREGFKKISGNLGNYAIGLDSVRTKDVEIKRDVKEYNLKKYEEYDKIAQLSDRHEESNNDPHHITHKTLQSNNSSNLYSMNREASLNNDTGTIVSGLLKKGSKGDKDLSNLSFNFHQNDKETSLLKILGHKLGEKKEDHLSALSVRPDISLGIGNSSKFHNSNVLGWTVGNNNMKKNDRYLSYQKDEKSFSEVKSIIYKSGSR